MLTLATAVRCGAQAFTVPPAPAGNSIVTGAVSNPVPPPMVPPPSARVPVAVPAALPATNAAGTNAAAPHIRFETPEYEFGKVSSGTVVKHDFIFTNVGTLMLEVSDVHPGCGCTTAGAWTRQVQPGQTGSIPIQFNSANFSGAVQKYVTVTCNDPAQPTTILHLKGTLWKPIDVNQQYVIFNPPADSQTVETRPVRIVNNMDQPLTLESPVSANRAFTAELKTLVPGKEFELTISTVPPLPYGSVQGPITIKTSATNMPVISINAVAMIQQPVMVSPAQLMLPAGPLGPNSKFGVTIRNNSATNMTLSDLAINLEGVDVHVMELQTGRVFNVLLSFPVGFEVPAGKKAELSFKSSHPLFPIIKVPITQAPRAAVPATPPIATMQPPVVVSPAQLLLPGGPLGPGRNFGVTIRNNSATNLTLSEPAINLEGVDVRVQELQAGHVFNVILGFPAGFEIPAGRKAELSVKSSHPLFPIIKVPIIQAPRAALPPPLPPQPIVRARPAFPNPPPVAMTNRVTAPMPPPPPMPN